MKKKQKINDLLSQDILESFIIHELNESKKKDSSISYYKEEREFSEPTTPSKNINIEENVIIIEF